MKKILFGIILVSLVLVGFFLIKNKIGVSEQKEVIKPLPSIFNKLAIWVPDATWKKPEKIIEITPYGKASGLEMTGEIRGEKASISRNFEDQKIMNDLGFIEDINFAADGPGSSNWGYSKTEKGKTRVAIFRYSTNALLGQESKEAPFVNLSIFVSDWFMRE